MNEIELGELEFTEIDFSNLADWNLAKDTAARANCLLRERLERAIKFGFDKPNWEKNLGEVCFFNKSDLPDKFNAVLVCVEEIK